MVFAKVRYDAVNVGDQSRRFFNPGLLRVAIHPEKQAERPALTAGIDDGVDQTLVFAFQNRAQEQQAEKTVWAYLGLLIPLLSGANIAFDGDHPDPDRSGMRRPRYAQTVFSA